MRSSRSVVWLSLLVFAAMGWAQKELQTEAQRDGLAGAVKTVSTIVDRPDVHWQQPAGPGLVVPLRCRECEYTQDGYRTKYGEVADGKFLGQLVTLNRDPNGRVTEVVQTDTTDAKALRHALLGPSGVTRMTFYQNGKVSGEQTFRYDSSGRVTDWTALDETGAQVDRIVTAWTSDTAKDSVWTERTSWGKEQQVRMRETYDPVTDEQHYTAFDDSGRVALTWTFAHGQVHSFWEASDSPGQPGDTFTDMSDKADAKAFHCRNSGMCEASQVHYEYADAAKRNPLSAEWRDSNGDLQYGAYYSYQFDSTGNWTHREISVWSSELGARTRYETDDRLITYWDK